MPVYKMMNEMPYEEFLKWNDFFGKRPIGWREDLRAYYILRANGVEKKGPEIFPSLIPIFGDSSKSNAISSLKGSYLFNKMMGAKGGDKLPILESL